LLHVFFPWFCRPQILYEGNIALEYHTGIKDAFIAAHEITQRWAPVIAACCFHAVDEELKIPPKWFRTLRPLPAEEFPAYLARVTPVITGAGDTAFSAWVQDVIKVRELVRVSFWLWMFTSCLSV